MSAAPDIFVEGGWLAARLADPDLKVVDASWYLPAEKRDPAAEFVARRIPGARFFSIDAIADPDHKLARMVPKPEGFAAAMAVLGINERDHVVVYDTAGLYSAARAWWMLRLFGHEHVSILAGGLPAWVAAGRPVESGPPPAPPPAIYRPRFRPELVRLVDAVEAARKAGTTVIADVRAAASFAGSDAPATGHIPGARNLPFAELIGPSGTLLPKAALAERFAKAGIPEDAPVIFSCGSGITACIGALAAEVAGRTGWSVFDGSWAEWSQRPDLPVERGPASG